MYKSITNITISTVLSVITGLFLAIDTTAPIKSVESTSLHNTVDQDTTTASVRLVVASNGNTARYLVREQLAGFNFPNDAVGETEDVTGVILLNSNGDVLSDGSSIVVDITELTSDQGMRDGFIQRNTLQTETYPTVELVPLQTRGLTFPLPTSGEATFDMVGNLTIRGVTRPTSWRVNAEFEGGTITGTARTEFTFEEFEMEKPSVGRVLSVADAIRLEFDFIMGVENVMSE